MERIVWYEGGRESSTAWMAGLNYAAACAALGGKWIQWNDMTKRPELFYVKKCHKATFRKAWSLMKEMQRDIKPEAAEATAAAGAATTQRPEAEQGQQTSIAVTGRVGTKPAGETLALEVTPAKKVRRVGSKKDITKHEQIRKYIYITF